jgi:hypothetical protein
MGTLVFVCPATGQEVSPGSQLEGHNSSAASNRCSRGPS